jgi:hypothetical protein
MTPEILSLTSDNDIHLVTFPAHITYLLQLLDVGVYRPLKEGRRKQLVNVMDKNPGGKPDRYDFSKLLAVAYRDVFQPTTVCNSFSKTGLFSFNRDAISNDAISPSLVTERKDLNDNEPEVSLRAEENSVITTKDVVRLPASKIQHKVPRNNPCAKILSLTGPAKQPTHPTAVTKREGN